MKNLYPLLLGALITATNSSSLLAQRTKNCNNQGKDLDYYLMMDPAELKSIEEGVASLGEGLGVFRKTEAKAKADFQSKAEGNLHETKGTVTDHTISSGEEGALSLASESEEVNKSLSQVAEYLTKAAKAHDEGRQEIAALWAKGAECMQASAEYDKKTAEASASNNREDKERFKNASHYFSSSALQLKQAVNALEKSAQAEVANQGELAALWLKTAKEHQESAEYFSQAVNACLNGKIADTTRWENAANFCKSSADQLELAGEALEKATNAIALSRQSVATCCSRLARQHQELAECYHQASNAWSTGNTTERTCFRSASCSADASVNRLKEASVVLEKAIEAMEADQGELAASWLKTVEQYQELAEYHFQATNAAISKNIADRNRFYREDRYYKPDTMDSAEQLQEATIVLGKAAQAKESGQGDVAELWIKIATQYQDLARYYCQVAYAWSSENCNGSYHFHEAKRHTESSTFQLKGASAALEKFTQVKESSQEVAEQWLKIVGQYQESAEHYYQAANGRFNNNNTDCNHFRQAGDFAKDHVTRLEKVAIALEKATQTKESNQKETIALRNEVVAYYKKSVEYQRQAEDAFLSGNHTGYNHLKNADSSAENSAERIEKAAVAYEKATQAERVNQKEVWLKVVGQYQESAKYYSEAANASSSGNETDYNRFENAADSIEKSAKRLEDAAKALEIATQARRNNAEEIGALGLKIARQYQGSAEYQHQAAIAKLGGNEAGYESFYKASKYILNNDSGRNRLESAVEALEEATKIEGADQEELQAQWIKAAKQYEESVEYSRQAENTRLSGNVIDNNLDRAANISDKSAYQLESVAIALREAAKAKSSKKEKIVALWLKIIAYDQESAEYYSQAVNAALSGNETDYNCFKDAGDAADKSSRLVRKKIFF